MFGLTILMTVLKSFRAYLIGAAIGFALGIAAVLYFTGGSEAKHVAKQAEQTVAVNAAEEVKAVQENQQIVNELETKKAETESVKDEVFARMDQTEKTNVQIVYRDREVQTTQPTCSVADKSAVLPLDVGAVRLLNGLRSATTVDLTGRTTGGSEAPATAQGDAEIAGVTVAEFVSNDTDIVGMYNDLAYRHNLLVAEVIKFKQQQAADAEKAAKGH